MAETTIRYFIKKAIGRAELDEFLKKRLEKAGYGGVDIIRTPLETRLTIYVRRPGIAIGRAGESIRELSSELEEVLGVKNLQVAVAEVEVPELNPHIMATRIASALERGIHFRRAGFWALNAIMEAGALGAEVIIKGKLRTQRATYEKYRAGYFLKTGSPAVEGIKEATTYVQLKPGTYGVKVRILSPNADILDKVALRASESPKMALAKGGITEE